VENKRLVHPIMTDSVALMAVADHLPMRLYRVVARQLGYENEDHRKVISDILMYAQVRGNSQVG